MSNGTAFSYGRMYFAPLGLAMLAFGCAQIILGVAGRTYTWGLMDLSGEFMLWRGVILFFAGFILLSSLKDFSNIHQQGKMVLANGMVWVIACMEIFAMIAESVPGGEDGGWFNTLDGFLGAYAGPYIPSLWLLPFSLVALHYIRLSRRGSNAVIP